MAKESIQRKLLQSQKAEITEHYIYKNLSEAESSSRKKKILEKIAEEEKRHYEYWRQHTNKEVKPSKWKIWLYLFLSKLFSLTFAVKLMESGEKEAQVRYRELSDQIPEATDIVIEEIDHERELIGILDEAHLNHIGGILRGLNEALVELIASLTILSFFLHQSILIGIVGLISGLAASISVAGSEYLSGKSESHIEQPKRAVFYSTSAHLFTVGFLVAPFLLVSSIYVSLGVMYLNAAITIIVINYYIAVVHEEPFKQRAFEMVLISLGAATLSMIVGYYIQAHFHVEV